MKLKQRMKIKDISADTVSEAVNGTIGMIQGYDSIQNAVKGTDELMAYSGQRTDQAFGVNYQAQNDINRQKAMDDISKSNKNATLGMVGSGAAAGAAIGSAIPGVGTLIGGAVGAITGLFGGLFGSKKAKRRQRRKIFNAQQKVNLINQVNQSSAATEGLTQQYYLDNGNTYDDVLYANRGKDLRNQDMLKGNKVWTPNGYQAGPVNSLVGKGESIIDYTNGTGTLVTKGKVGVDNQPSSVRRDDNNVIAGNDIDWSNGMKFSDQVAPLTAKLQMYNDIEKRTGKKSDLSSLSKQTIELQKNQLDRAKAHILQAMKNITDRQEKQHQIEDYAAQIKHNCGKDRFNKGKSFWKSYITGGKGKVSNLMLDTGYALPALLETQMLNHWRRENPVMPNIYAANRYAPIALQTMAGNRVSANPVLEKLYAQDRQAAYQLANSGGYTGGQRQANRVALALGNQRNVADALMNVQEKNAAYRNAYAEMAARLGDSDAQRLQQSNQYGWEAYNRAHGAKTKGIETHLSNLGLIGQKWLSQRIKNKQYGDILDIYQQDVDNKKEALKTIDYNHIV